MMPACGLSQAGFLREKIRRRPMRQTLFTIDQAWLEGPLLIGWLILGALIVAGLVWRHGWKGETLNFLPVYIAVAAVLYFVAPRIGITDINPADPGGPEIKVGLAIRGYGVMMLAGILVGVSLSIYRGSREGIHAEKIISLAIWMCVCGIVGARLFYVIQKRDQFGGSLPQMLGEMINMTQGGLVVYGALAGACLGGAFYVWRSRLPVLRVADIIIPGMFAGLALGRIGCLLNGCCYGAVCDMPQLAQSFPAGAPPYLRQIETGELIGIHATDGRDRSGLPEKPTPQSEWFAESIEEGSVADKAGIAGQQWYCVRFTSDKAPDKELRALKQRGLEINSVIAVQQDHNWVSIPLADLPDDSLGVYPTQILAAVNAALLTILLWFYYPFGKRHGQVFAVGIVLYAITRFLLEMIRVDEGGMFGTDLTISQWVSLLMMLGGCILLAVAPSRQAGSTARQAPPAAGG
jgi:phosphatidylglycerol:prolipoprotein diacylglycerol transferase